MLRHREVYTYFYKVSTPAFYSLGENQSLRHAIRIQAETEEEKKVFLRDVLFEPFRAQ